jgi:hypothetical protein
LAFGLLARTAAGAQDQAPIPAQEAATDRQAPVGGEDANKGDPAAKPGKDILDWLRELRHKPVPPPPGPDDYKKWMIAVAPVLTYGPTSGFGIGIAGNVAVYKGSPATTRISSLVASVTGTTKEQVLVSAKINAHSLEDLRHFEGDNRLHWTSQKTYGLGTSTSETGAVDQKYDYLRFYETQYRRVARDVYVGGGFLYSAHTDVRPADDDASADWPDSPYVAYSQQHGFDPASQTRPASGCTRSSTAATDPSTRAGASTRTSATGRSSTVFWAAHRAGRRSSTTRGPT